MKHFLSISASLTFTIALFALAMLVYPIGYFICHLIDKYREHRATQKMYRDICTYLDMVKA